MQKFKAETSPRSLWGLGTLKLREPRLQVGKSPKFKSKSPKLIQPKAIKLSSLGKL